MLGFLAVLAAMRRVGVPEFFVPDAEFQAFVAERVPDGKPAEHLADLYLACACARGDRAALAAFDTRFLRDIERVIARYHLAPSERDELKQQLRHRLFVADGGPPKIAAYSGGGPLVAWVRTVCTRLVLDLVRRSHRELNRMRDDGDAALVDASGSDPELAYLKKLYAGEFKTAFGQALAELSARERLLLRFHYVDGLSTERIASLQSVHAVTVLRRLGRARDLLLRETRKRLRSRLQVSPSQLESIERLIRSDIQVSLSQVLGGRSPAI